MINTYFSYVPLMTNSIVSNFNDFNFDGLSLAQPHAIQGGTYFTRLTNAGESLYIQTPKCSTKQGITKTEHKIYTDLIFSQDDNEFIEWLERLETRLQKLIFDKRTSWFHNDLDLDDIENAFSSMTRSYKSGKNYLLRCNLGKGSNSGLKQDIRIFNESEKDIKLDDVKPGDNIITILEVSGIRFSSRSFHVDIYVKQLMVFQNDSPFKSCLIKPVDHAKTNGASIANDNDNDKDIESEDETISSLSQHNSDASDDETENESDRKEGDERTMQQNTVTTKTDEPKESLGDIEKNPDVASPLIEKSLDESSNITKSTEALEEVELSFETVDDEIKLRDPNEVYMQIYMEARQKAKLAKKAAIEAYLNAKKIKNTYLLEEIDDSDEEDISNFSEN